MCSSRGISTPTGGRERIASAATTVPTPPHSPPRADHSDHAGRSGAIHTIHIHRLRFRGRTMFSACACHLTLVSGRRRNRTRRHLWLQTPAAAVTFFVGPLFPSFPATHSYNRSHLARLAFQITRSTRNAYRNPLVHPIAHASPASQATPPDPPTHSQPTMAGVQNDYNQLEGNPRIRIGNW